MRIIANIVDASELSLKDADLWNRIASSSVNVDVPSFNPFFVRAVGALFPETKVAVLQRGNRVIGYAAYSLRGNTRAYPIPMCDHQPLILLPGEEVDLREIVRAIGLSSATLENVILARHSLAEASNLKLARAYKIRRRGTLEDYHAELRSLQKSPKRFTERIRIVQRDLGSLRLRHGINDEDTLDRLLTLKAHKYASGDAFPKPVRDLLLSCLEEKVAGLKGRISVLSAGEHTIAYIYWLKIGTTAYYWFPTYDPMYKRYSPGLTALWKLIEELPELGCDVLDLGPGGEQYKMDFSNDFVMVANAQIYASLFKAQVMAGVDLALEVYRAVPAAKRLVGLVRGLR